MAKKKGDEKVNQAPQSDNEEPNYDEEPDFEDPEGFVDDIPDEELLADLLEQKPKESDSYENVVVVDGCPQVGPERLEKLQSVINKIFSKFGKIVNEYYPTQENGNTTGYIFLEYSNPQNAAEAVKATNNCKLDKQHTFLVNLFTDFQKYSDIPKEWEPPAPQPFKVASDLQWYLMDPDAYDQFLVGIGTGIALQVWQNALPEPTLMQERPNWTETYAAWSPLGTYLATFHWRGVALWAGPKFSQFQKFFHPEARFISFSPCENYIVTFSPTGDRGEDKKLIIWDIRNKAVTPVQQVLIALEYYACGSFQRCVGDTAGVHKSTVSRIIYRVSRAIASMRAEWISMPQTVEEKERTATEFYDLSAFPKVIGAIDCTHIPIKSPGGPDAENYRNRKLTFSMNVQVICDAKMYITNIVARWPGSSHDSHIFNSSVIKGRLEDGEFNGYWLLGDKGYAVKPYLLTPLRDPVTDGEKLYNESQIRTRNVVERVFGCWKRRFPALSMKIRTHIDRVQPIIVATAVLYNICKKYQDPMPPLSASNMNQDSYESTNEEDNIVYTVARNDDLNRSQLINSYFNRLCQ